MERRLFLKSAMAGSAVATAVTAGLLTPTFAIADVAKFEKVSTDVTARIAGASKGSFKFKAPKVAENGAVVPLTIDASKMLDVTSITLVIMNNSTPMAASFALSGAKGFVSTRVKMGKTSPVVAFVVAGGKDYAVTKEVTVTIGGCGG
jgi:sulfur-oxidizing protein SoxY